MFSPSIYKAVEHLDLLSWTFGNTCYDLNKPIFIDAYNDNDSVSYQQARELVRKLIAGLKARGLRTGDTVCLHSFNNFQYTMIYLAVIGAGGRFVGSNPAHTLQELTDLFKLAEVKFVVAAQELLNKVITTINHCSIPITNVFIFDAVGQLEPPYSWDVLLEYGEEDWVTFNDEARCKTTTAALMSTSGTTGLPKAAEISHHALIAQSVMFHDTDQKPYEIKRLLCLPQFHSFNSALFLAPLREGHPTYIMKSYNLKQFLDFIPRYGITETTLINDIIFDLLAVSEPERGHIATLRFIWCGGEPLSASVQNRFSSILHPEAIVSQVYGLTENSGWLTTFSYPEKDYTGAVGRLLPNVEARIVDENMNDVSDGDQGQILIKSPSLMMGYVENPKATEEAIVNGWLLTGDIGYQQKGKWYIVDRAKELIKVRGWQVSPAEIEACLLSHSAIVDVAVIGVESHDKRGELPRAYVVVDPTHPQLLTDEAIADHLNGRLANYKALTGGVRRMLQIPRNASGKILKKLLKDEAKNEIDAAAHGTHFPHFNPERTENITDDLLEMLEPCMVLSPGGINERSEAKTTLPVCLKAPRSIHAFCEYYKLGMESFFKGVWSLVLWTYLNMDQISFGISQTPDSQIPVIKVFSLLVERESTVGSFFQGLSSGDRYSLDRLLPAGSDIDAQRICNTKMIVTNSGNNESRNCAGPNNWSICVFISIDQSCPSMSIQFANSFISNDQAWRIIETTSTILLRLLSNADRPVISICEPTTKDIKSLFEWNGKIPRSSNFLVHQLINARANISPTATAVYAWDGSLTYSELEEQSICLSEALEALGVGPEMPVLLCVQKSKLAPLAMLAILKTGGVCVPISPSFPPHRIEEIMRITNANFALCGMDLPNILKQLGPVVVAMAGVCICSHNPSIATSIHVPVEPHNTAFIIFTSGSTGEPKGVLKDHASISSSAVAHGSAFNINPSSRVLQYAAHIWSISIYDFVSPLIHGGCVCIPSENDRINKLAATIRELEVTHATLPPSVITTLKPYKVPSLKTLILGGEPVPRDAVQEWCEMTSLFNNYGTTETLCAAATRLNNGDRGSIVGYNTSANCCWIVDPLDHDRLMPIGAIGELVVEGWTVASGYLNNAERTIASFIKSPTWLGNLFLNRQQESMRFYKTGDLARYGTDGRVEIMGRKDDQIKIRGQRVEPGDVELHLRQHLPRARGIVVGLSNINQKKQPVLTAFVAPFRSNNAGVGDGPLGHRKRVVSMLGSLEERLKASLPAYMVPYIFYPVSEFPRTMSGKLDRRRLRRWAEDGVLGDPMTFADVQISKQPSRPLSNSEILLLKSWSCILRVTEELISPDDNFFYCGGDSVDAITLAENLRSDGLALTVQDVFKHPKFGDMAAVIRLDDSKVEEPITAFSLLSAGSKATIMSAAKLQCNVPAAAIEDIYPCTALQEGLFSLSQFHVGSYVAQHEFKLVQRWTIEHYERAWKRLVSETPILRTRIISSDQKVFQVILRSNASDGIKVMPSAANNSAIPLMGFSDALMRSEFTETKISGEYRWLWTVHHAIYDGWSVAVILRKFQQLLDGNCKLVEATQSIPSYRSFVRYLQTADRSLSKSYWSTKLSSYGGTHFPEVPSAYEPRANRICYRNIPVVTTNLEFTMSTLIRAALSITLARYGRSSEVVFGAIVTGRTAPVTHIKDIVGPTIATVPIRISIERGIGLHNYLSTIQQQSTEMLPHEQYGMQNIQRLNEGAALASKFQTLLIVQPKAIADTNTDLQEVAFRSNNYLTYPLTIECSLDISMVAVEATFDENVIQHEQLDRMLSQFAHVLGQLQLRNSSELILGDLQLISPEDEASILRWNATPPKVVYSSITHLIMQKTAECRMAMAVCAWDGTFSYETLDNLSTKFAIELAQRGVGPEAFVPLCFRKSKWMVVAILAIIKAGGAFVLLDLSHPFERLQKIVSMVDSTIIICTTEDVQLGRDLDLPVVHLDQDAWKELPLDSGLAQSKAGPHNALYVTFTSGSTGEPKGIVIEHWQCASGFQAQIEAGLFTSSSRILQFASASFDSTIEQIIAPLLAGGCVCIPHEAQRLQNLAGVIRDFQVNIADLTPSVAKILEPKDVPGLQVLRLSGEQVSETLVRRWAGFVRVENSYGPSECSVTSMTNYNLVAGAASASNIGRSVGCIAWIVEPDDPSRLTPIGAVGELLIEGPIVGRGYIKRVVQSAAVFLELTGKGEGSRVKWRANREYSGRAYRTGDLARYESDGSICFVGRADSQTKIRGQRIELGEIEHRLSSHPAVSESIVIKPTSGIYQEKLVAIIQLNVQGPLTDIGDSCVEVIAHDEILQLAELHLDTLRESLSRYLPSFMIPTDWIAVRKLPMSRTGKTDRKMVEEWLSNISDAFLGLPLDALTRSIISEDETTAFRLCCIAARLGSKGKAQVDDDARQYDRSLQAAGVDSISIIHLLNIIEEEFHVGLDLQKIVRATSIRKLAQLIDDKIAGTEDASHSAIDFANEVSQLCMQHQLYHKETNIRPMSRSLSSVLITGATGYLGTHLLKRTLDSLPTTKIIALVRGSDESHAFKRLIHAAKLSQWWSELYISRIEVWVGNLADPHLGLTIDQWQRLSGSSQLHDNIDAIIHNGAEVNWFATYESLKPTNTIATARLLKLSKSSASIQRLIYISGGPQWDPNISQPYDDATFNMMLQNSNGYGQSKLVAERLIEKSESSKTAYIKPGFVIGTLADGTANIDDFIWRIVAGSIAIGCFNEEEEGQNWILLAGADVFSDTVLECLAAPESRHAVKVLSGLMAKDFWTTVVEVTGKKLHPTSHLDWVDQLQRNVETMGPDHPCWPVMSMVQHTPVLGGKMPANMKRENHSMEKAISTVRKNLEYLARINFLPLGDDFEGPVKESFQRRKH